MSIPIKLKLNSSNDVKMSLKSHGDIDTITEVALIIEGDNFDYKFSGKIVDGIVHIKIPKMQNVMESGSYTAHIDIVADGDKFFKPYNGSVVFQDLGKVDVSEAVIEDTLSDVKVELIQEDELEEEAVLNTNITSFSEHFKD